MSIETKWCSSHLHRMAYLRFLSRLLSATLGEKPPPVPYPRFEDSKEFRDARYSFRKIINKSWDKEST